MWNVLILILIIFVYKSSLLNTCYFHIWKIFKEIIWHIWKMYFIDKELPYFFFFYQGIQVKEIQTTAKNKVTIFPCMVYSY